MQKRKKKSSGFVEKEKLEEEIKRNEEVVGWVGRGLTQSGGGEERSWPGVTRSGPSCMSAGG